MILFPAIDLRHGHCVRLRQGDPRAETIYGDNPVAIARRWVADGASWLHVVNLDGALEDERASALNLQALAAILAAVTVPVQFGGGLRGLEAVSRVLDLGVTRVVLGTAALQDPEMVHAAVKRFGCDAIVAGLDAREGRIAIRGWQETTATSAVDLGRRMRELGVERAVYTDIRRDGMLSGPNLPALSALAQESGLRLIASGGIARLEDLQALRRLGPWLEGAIIGQALYSGAIDLRAAIATMEMGPEAENTDKNG